MERLLIVSPHLDDAALSCASLLARSEGVDVLTVFAGEPNPPRQGSWDRETGFESSAQSMPIRRAEERAAYRGTPHRLTMLDLLECQYVPGSRSTQDATATTNAVLSWATEAGRGTVALPVGAGRQRGRIRGRIEDIIGPRGGPIPHEDHLFVRDAVVPVAATRDGITLLLYEEFPYAWGGPGDREASELAARLGRRAVLAVEPVDVEIKALRIGAYASQVPFLLADGTRLDRPEALPPFERYWRLVEE